MDCSLFDYICLDSVKSVNLSNTVDTLGLKRISSTIHAVPSYKKRFHNKHLLVDLIGCKKRKLVGFQAVKKHVS